MTAKKRWLKKIYQDSQEFKSSPEKISWSSSDSEYEDLFNKCVHTNKKKKVNKSVAKKWIKSSLIKSAYDSDNYHQDNCVKMNAQIESSIFNFQFPETLLLRSKNSVSEQNLTEISKLKEISVEYVDPKINSTISGHSCDSPIINSLKLEELSPVLIQNSDNIDLTNEASPILGQRSILKRVRSNYKRKHEFKQQIFEYTRTSPDLFTTQSTQVIDCESPNFSSEDNLSPIKPPLTECIVPFPSQCASEVKISDASSSDSSSRNSLPKTNSTSSLYHQPAPRKKNYKKGGLASLLQKVLHLQRTRTSIWQHEIYTNKSDHVDIDEREIIEFLIKKEWREYGNTLLECGVINKCSNTISSTNDNNDQTFIFIIVIGYSATLNIVFKVGCTYKLFPPYSSKNIIYESREIPCYFNITKLILCKEKTI